jgi:hypothetical protein
MSIQDILNGLSGVVLMCALVPYLRSIVRRETKAQRVTWLVWSVGDIIAFIGTVAAGKPSLLLLGALIGASLTFIASLMYGETTWTKRDIVCLGLSLVGFGLWKYFGDSSLGIILSLVSLVVAAWPLYVSAWHNPSHEDKLSWVLFNLSSFIALFAIKHLTVAEAAPAITFVVIDAPVLYLLFVRPNLKVRLMK